MKYAIVYRSQTGNTKLLAECLREQILGEELIYFGEPGEEALTADLIFVGFWTDKGSCSEDIAAFLKRLSGKQVFLFGTAGFGGDEAYFSQILSRVSANIDNTNKVVGSYMCQGKMPLSIRRRYEVMSENEPEKMLPMLENFDRALPHPDERDAARFLDAARQCM